MSYEPPVEPTLALLLIYLYNFLGSCTDILFYTSLGVEASYLLYSILVMSFLASAESPSLNSNFEAFEEYFRYFEIASDDFLFILF